MGFTFEVNAVCVENPNCTLEDNSFQLITVAVQPVTLASLATNTSDKIEFHYTIKGGTKISLCMG